MGNLKSNPPDLANFQKGETVIGFLWDYLALEYRDQLEGQVNLEIVVPEDASIAGPYASIINKFAPHPYAARLLRNYILSPEGQALYAEGYATPILPDVEIPEEVAAKRPSAGGLRQRAHDRGLEPGLHRLPADRRRMGSGTSWDSRSAARVAAESEALASQVGQSIQVEPIDLPRAAVEVRRPEPPRWLRSLPCRCFRS